MEVKYIVVIHRLFETQQENLYSNNHMQAVFCEYNFKSLKCVIIFYGGGGVPKGCVCGGASRL